MSDTEPDPLGPALGSCSTRRQVDVRYLILSNTTIIQYLLQIDAPLLNVPGSAFSCIRGSPWVVGLTQKDGPLFFSPLLSHMFLDELSQPTDQPPQCGWWDF